MTLKKPLVVCDIDGVIADDRHRHHLINSEVSNWDKYYDLCKYDTGIHSRLQLLEALSHDFVIVLATGRVERIRRDTKIWLQNRNVRFEKLLMRANNDFRSNAVLKAEMAMNLILGGDTIRLWIDDNPKVSYELERELRIPTLIVPGPTGEVKTEDHDEVYRGDSLLDDEYGVLDEQGD